MRVEVRSLEPTEAAVAGALFHGSADLVRSTVSALRAEDFTSPALVAVVRAVDRTLRAGGMVDVSTVVETAIAEGIIRPGDRARFAGLCVDLMGSNVTMGEPALWYAQRIVLASVRRAAGEAAVRVRQAADEVGDPGELAGALEGVAADLEVVVARLRTEVAA